MSKRTTTILATGDITFRGADPETITAGVAGKLGAADATIGHVETPYTLHPQRTGVNQSQVADPALLRGLELCGIDIATLAGNHIWDAGEPGLVDTIDWLDAHGIARTGAGRTLDDARRMALVERSGVKIGVLSYNCTGPRDGWATSNKPGTAYVHVITHYDLDHDCPGGAPSVYTFPTYPSLAAFEADVRAARGACDILVVALHKGILHRPIVLADYEVPLSRAAIDAGADVVVGHHAHVLRGIEMYRGKPIYHGLGNFILPSTRNAKADGHPQDFMARRTRLYDFEPISDAYRFHPDARFSLVAKIEVEAGAGLRAKFIPLLIDEMAVPHVVSRDAGGEEVFAYVRHISKAAGLSADFAWDGDEVVVSPAG